MKIIIIFIVVLFLSTVFIVYAQDDCPMNDQFLSNDALSSSISFFSNLWEKSGTSNPSFYPTFSPFFIEEGFSPESFINSGGSPEKSALCFIKHYPDIFKLDNPDEELEVVQVTEDDVVGYTHVKLNRIFKGIPVFASQLIIHFNQEGQVSSFNGNYHRSFTISLESTLSADEAIKIAKKDAGSPAKKVATGLLIYPKQQSYLLSWGVDYAQSDGPTLGYIIDAHTGEVLFKDPGIRTAGGALADRTPPLKEKSAMYVLLGFIVLLIAIFIGWRVFKK